MPEVGNEMNGVLFLLPFLAIVSFGLSQDSFADETIVGYNYFDVTNPDGTHTWSSHEPYIFDGENYVPYIRDGLTVDAPIGTVTLNPDGSYNWNGKFTDRIIGKYADISDLTSWTYPNSLNNDIPDLSFVNDEFHSNKIKSGVADMDYKYVFNNGKWKTELIVTNLSGLTTKVFGFDQVIDLNSDSIKFGGISRNLDNFDGVTFDKEFLDNNQGKVLDLLNGVDFDFDLGYENLYSVTVHDTGVNSSQLVFDYRTDMILLPGETLIIDPTFGYTTASTQETLFTAQHTAGTCIASTSNATLTANTIGAQDSGINGRCWQVEFEFNIDSIIAAGPTTIDSVKIHQDLTLDNGMTNCDVYYFDDGMGNLSIAQKADRAKGTGSTLLVDNDTFCDSTGTDVEVDLSSVGNALVLSTVQSGGSYAGFAINIGDYPTREAFNTYITYADPQLEIIYTTIPAPDKIDDLTYANLDSDSVDLIWTEPNLNTGNVTNYMVNSTTPWSSTTNFLANTTSLFYNVTGLNWGTDYSFSASVLTEGGYNFTGNVLNITTTSPLYTGVAPTSLTVNDCSHTCTTQLNLEWTAALMDNINGFRIFFETPIGNGFTTLTANTTNTNTYYNDTGLTPGIFYNYKVAAMNSSGISENSTAYAQSPHKLPDSVTDLVITSNDLLQFLASWTQPDLYGTLNGYQINYTTPAGDPTTIYTSTNPGVTATISGLNPTVEYSFRVGANTYHGINATFGNIENATASSEIAVGDLDFDFGDNDDATPIWFENYIVDTETNDVQVRFDSSLTVDCSITERIANNVNNYTSLSETSAGSYVYHNFTVTNAGNDILDFDCWEQTDPTISGDYSLAQSESASGVGGIGNVPMFAQMANFTAGLYGTEGDFAGIDLITLFIVIISMLGFNKKSPALGVGVMATLLGAAYVYGLIPWTSTVLGGIAVVLVLAIGQGLKK